MMDLNGLFDDSADDLLLPHECKRIAKHFAGDVGVELFDFYEIINRHFFDGELPQAFLLTALTPYGGCIGMTKADISHNPIILIHPSLTTEKERFYTVLHEAIHVQVRYNLRPGCPDGAKTSHSTPEWIAEVNRIATMLGYQDITLGENKVTRVKSEDGTSKIQRRNTGTFPYECTYHFPQALEQATGQLLPPVAQWIVTRHRA